MKLLFKILGITFSLVFLFSILFLIWGDSIESKFANIEYLEQYNSFAWIVADLLLIADLILPIPATPIMAALGKIYGPVYGSLFAIIGSASAGITGYWLARAFGKSGVKLISSDDEIEKFRGFFESWGVYAIIISRALPIMPEVMCILAGLSRMSFKKFLVSLLAGTIPVATLLAIAGDSSEYAVLIAVTVPVLLWPIIFAPIIFGKSRKSTEEPETDFN